jgi:hypothetical protein
MQVQKIDGFESYMIGFYKDATDGKYHYSNAKFYHKGYEVVLPRVYYKTMEEAVRGLKFRITEAIVEFDLKLKDNETDIHNR